MYERISDQYGWPQTFVGDGSSRSSGWFVTACQTRQQGEG